MLSNEALETIAHEIERQYGKALNEEQRQKLDVQINIYIAAAKYRIDELSQVEIDLGLDKLERRARKMLEALEELDPFIHNRLQAFSPHLVQHVFDDTAQLLHAIEHDRQKSPVPHKKIKWTSNLLIEKMRDFLKEIGVEKVAAQNSSSTGKPDGPFVRLLIAINEALPESIRDTGDLADRAHRLLHDKSDRGVTF